MRPIPFLPGRTDFEKLDAILQVSANSGYSIPNVHQRVQLLFGADYGLSYGRSPSGTTASLHLPIEQARGITENALNSRGNPHTVNIAPNKNNPNLISLRERFGLFLLLEGKK